ncbi:glycine-rich domain-containing protein [Rhizobium sp. 11515TR]|uniref:glycine-rich domain-containing protein n=1 Tax=Rhizobium sp. 11515TR TaxID=2028343 RepID=UPI0011B5E160|nr:hypothetical protein [Rhizobium sp. 11515TR]
MNYNSKIIATIFAIAAAPAFAQTSPGFTYGQVPTASQWNSYFAGKQDTLGYTPVNKARDTMLGPLTTSASTTSGAGFVIPQGLVPTSPINGSIWLTPSGLYYQANGITFGPIGAGTITGPATTTVGNVAKWGNTSGTALVDGGTLGTAATQNTGTSGHNLPFLDGSNTWSAAQIFSEARISGAAGTYRPLKFQTSGSDRWWVTAGNGAESGANAGTAFVINSYDDTGTYLATPFSITRSTGAVNLSQPLAVSSGGTGGTTQATARSGIGAAASGANSDITSLSGLSTALSVAQGGTGGNTQATARTGLGLGTVATLNAGTSANNVVQLNGSAQLPAVDGSLLTGVVASGGLVNVQVFKTSGTYTRTSGATTGTVMVIGGGGAGGGSIATASNTFSIGGGGGAGAYCVLFNYALPSSATVTIGSGGTGVSASTGNNGTASSFNSTCTANGGSGGQVQSGTPSYTATGGVGGTIGSTGTIDAGGENGNYGVVGSGTANGGQGGSTLYGAGGGGTAAPQNGSANGVNAAGFGAGGGGAGGGFSQTAKTGGNGAGGIVVVYEYR